MSAPAVSVPAAPAPAHAAPAASSGYAFDAKEVLVRILKYFFEGLVVAIAAYVMPQKRMDLVEVVLIGLVAAATFSVLDLFAPSVGASVRTGAGFGVGANLVGFPGNRLGRL